MSATDTLLTIQPLYYFVQSFLVGPLRVDDLSESDNDEDYITL